MQDTKMALETVDAFEELKPPKPKWVKFARNGKWHLVGNMYRGKDNLMRYTTVCGFGVYPNKNGVHEIFGKPSVRVEFRDKLPLTRGSYCYHCTKSYRVTRDDYE